MDGHDLLLFDRYERTANASGEAPRAMDEIGGADRPARRPARGSRPVYAIGGGPVGKYGSAPAADQTCVTSGAGPASRRLPLAWGVIWLDASRSMVGPRSVGLPRRSGEKSTGCGRSRLASGSGASATAVTAAPDTGGEGGMVRRDH